MPMKITVRKALPKDAPAILDITKEAFSKYAFDLGMPEKVKALKESEAVVLDDMQRKTVLVAELDGVPVGTIRYEQITPSMAYISRFGVGRGAQSCGGGGARGLGIRSRAPPVADAARRRIRSGRKNRANE